MKFYIIFPSLTLKASKVFRRSASASAEYWGKMFPLTRNSLQERGICFHITKLLLFFFYLASCSVTGPPVIRFRWKENSAAKWYSSIRRFKSMKLNVLWSMNCHIEERDEVGPWKKKLDCSRTLIKYTYRQRNKFKHVICIFEQFSASNSFDVCFFEPIWSVYLYENKCTKNNVNKNHEDKIQRMWLL